MSRVLIDHAIGETRAVHLDADDRPLRLFVERWSERERRAWRGRTLSGLVRSRDFDAGGQFVELETGDGAFMRLPKSERIPPQGLRLELVVEAEAQNGKMARVRRPSQGEPVFTSAFDAWLASLKPGRPEIVDIESPEDRASLDAAFDAALSNEAVLPGGGLIRITSAGTLTAIDVDSAGRAVRSRDDWTSGSWSRDLNLEAARIATRRLNLAEIGGLVVLDCVAPLKRGVAEEVKDAFEQEFKALSRRQAIVLTPSKLGLMEISVERAFQPLIERFGTPEARAIDAIRQLESEARAQPGATLILSVPLTEHDWLSSPPFDWQMSLADRIGRRFRLDPAPATKVKVSAS